MIIVAVKAEAEALEFSLLTLMMTTQACWPNTRNSMQVIPLYLAMWPCPTVLLQIQVPSSHLQSDFTSKRALGGHIWSSFLYTLSLSGKMGAVICRPPNRKWWHCSSISFLLQFCQEGRSEGLFFTWSILICHTDIFCMDIQHLPLLTVEHLLLWLNVHSSINVPWLPCFWYVIHHA
jgi:hypothetical protein